MRKGTGYIPGAPGATQHSFAKVPTATIPRSVFNRSHTHKTTFLEGYLIPFYVDEVLPGDTHSCRLTAFVRLSTLLFPIMDNMYFETFFFFVPNRLIWSHWPNFNGEQVNPADSTSYTLPQFTAFKPAALSLHDYMGVPPQSVNNIQFTSMFARAYNKIWNDCFRDENLQNSVTVDLGDGPDNSANYVLLQRGKRHDYFTSCLPWPQKINDGGTLNLPLQGTAPVLPNTATTTSPTFYDGSHTGNQQKLYIQAGGATPPNYISGDPGSATVGDLTWKDPGLYANLAGATGVTINELRQAFQIQKMYERDARGGTRYIEIIKSHFGVDSPDARLQRSEYLGGGHTPLNIHPVAQTSGTGMTGETTPQANLAAFGTCSVVNHGFTKSFTEHGIIIGLCCVRADITYQQGLSRMFSRSTRFDFYWPALSHIGEQSVLNKEIYCDGSGNDSNVFGYQERSAEYRYKPSMVTGEFRSSYSTPLDAWHLAQNFGSLPTLNSTFIVENAPMSRILASGAVTHFLLDAFFSVKSARPMPVYAVPGLIDHF